MLLAGCAYQHPGVQKGAPQPWTCVLDVRLLHLQQAQQHDAAANTLRHPPGELGLVQLCAPAVHTSIQVFRRVPRNPGLAFWMCVCSIYSRHSSTMLPQTPFATLLESWAWCSFVPRPNFMQTVEDQVGSPTASRSRALHVPAFLPPCALVVRHISCRLIKVS